MSDGKLLLVALGAAASADGLKMKKMPRLGALAARGALVTEVAPVFLSNAYPCLTSMITGVQPSLHGVIDDTVPGAPSRQWRHTQIKVPTLITKTRSAGQSVCSVMWPATLDADTPLQMTDTFPYGRRFRAALTATSNFAAKAFLKHGRIMTGEKQPGLDDFAVETVLDCLRTNQPELTLLRLSDYDWHKNVYGPSSSEAQDALARYDKRVGLLVDALWETGALNNTDIIICGDYGSLPAAQTVDLNRFLGAMSSDAKFHQTGGAAFLRLLRRGDVDLQRRAAKMIKDILDDPQSGVSRVLSQEEFDASGLGDRFDLGLEAAPGYRLSADGEQIKAVHGHTPQSVGNTFYLAAGPHIPEDLELSGGCITDICALSARVLNLPMWDMAGEARIPVMV
ncbi:MAG: alkaline phosphatase family protein [Oscillospiraceae bacterium]|jgi:hypothetical protein|nr:alkaline phosphatase family protein [Oscillospiraceae bacterium]